MKNILQIIICLAIVNGQWLMVNSQSISRKVVSSAGGTMTAGGSMLTYNIGEPAVHTLTAGGSMLTQGFEQPGEQITTGTVTPLSYCAGTAVSVPFSAIDIGGGNTFTAQLSNAAGSFASPVTIGTLAGNASGTINATIPVSTPAGSGYRIRVVSNSPGKNGSDNGGNIAVSNGPPSNSVALPSAPAEACNGTVSLITVNIVGGTNVTYSWNTGSNSSVVLYSNNIGGPFTAGPFSTTANQVYAQFGALAGGSGYNICVQGVNPCGSTNNKCVWIRGIVSVPGTITPANGAVACPNDVKNYSCGVSGGASVYSWTLAGSSSPVTSGQGTQNVQVTFPAGFTSGQLCVTASLGCGGSSVSAPRCMLVSKTPIVPGAMSGPTKVCPGSAGVVFSVPAVTGATGYTWTTPAGTTITSGQGSASITVNFPTPFTTSSPVCVTANSNCASSVARCQSVSSYIPGQPGSMTGSTTNICNSTVQYSVPNVPGATSYNWTNPAGTTITSGQTTTTILLSVGSTFTSGFLSVTASTTACTPGTGPARTITIYGKPNTPVTIAASPASWCNGGFVNFSTAGVTPAVTCNWSVSNGTITAGQGGNNIDVTWGTGTGNVTVNASNTCGTSSNRVQSFTGVICREDQETAGSGSQQFSVYPNPAHEILTMSIDVKEQSELTWQFYDITGRAVLSKIESAMEGLNNYKIGLTHLSKGVYMLDVKAGGESWKTKVAVE